MAQPPPLTPEEKLLRIIESPPEVARSMGRRVRLPHIGFSFKAFKARGLVFLKDRLNLKSASAAVVLVSAASTIFLGLDFWMGMPRVGTIQRLEAKAKHFDAGDLSIARLDPLAVYQQDITQRNIFFLPEPVPEPPPAAAASAAAAAADAAVLTDGLKLVGIIWSEAPQAVVEDTKEARTNLLNRGGKIRNLRVKEILKDKVILSYDGQEIELR